MFEIFHNKKVFKNPFGKLSDYVKYTQIYMSQNQNTRLSQRIKRIYETTLSQFHK